jgi:hypothetical protein
MTARPVVPGPVPGGGAPTGDRPRFEVFEQEVPWPRSDPGPLPDGVLQGFPFLALDADLPLLLLPVRVETRYRLDAGPPELRIRIFPDQLHIDADRPEPSAAEAEVAITFWRRYQAAGDGAGRAAAWRAFAGRVGTRRAGHLARLLRPHADAGGAPRFPPPPQRPERAPARPVLLPRQWLAIGYQVDPEDLTVTQLFQRASVSVREDLRTGPDPAAPTWEVVDSGLVIDDGLAWMVDYDRAVEAGMAITVPLTGAAAPAAERVDTLLVVGVDHELDPDTAQAELARLLDVHTRTTGLAFVAQGTPTNNTDTATSGWSGEEPGPEDTAASAARVARELSKPVPVSDGNADRLAAALGIADASSLRRVELGDDTEYRRSRAMRVVTFEAVLGTLLRELLDVGVQSAIGADAVNRLLDWFVDHVTGGAPVPTLRVGPQPYGILPVHRWPPGPTEPVPVDPPLDPTSVAFQVERIVTTLLDVWRASAANVIESRLVLDSDQADIAGTGRAETAIASILATQPHPARLFVRGVTDYDALGNADEQLTPQGRYREVLEDLEAADVLDPASPDYEPGLTEVSHLYDDIVADEYPPGSLDELDTIDEQIDVWTEIETRMLGFPNAVRAPGLDKVGDALGPLGEYEERQRPLRWLGLDAFEGALGEENTKVVAAAYDEASTEWGEVALVQAPDAGAGHTAADYLADLRARLEARAGALPPPSLPDTFLDQQPLLYQLIDRSLSLVPRDPAVKQRVLDALDDLAALDPATLEWLARECLGLGTHRLDAWATSLASDRLDRLRAARPVGIQVGAFGWVTNLAPRASARPSEGFVHAPSMAHATTAALLRAGWHAHGSDDPASPAAVDLRSGRLRDAGWLLDGVRAGQPLGDLLGYRFERALHDLGASGQIRDVRQQVLDAAGKPDVAPDRPVDGIELLELARGEGLDHPTDEVEQALATLDGAFDAVNDAALFEAVHQLTAGNAERATAMLDAVALGTRTPPELRAPRTPRGGRTVEHRVVVLLDPDAPPPGRGWSAGIRDAVAPALDAWVASLLPRADEVGFAVLPPGAQARTSGNGQPAQGGPPVAATLADLGISALDAIHLVGDDPAAPPPALLTLAAGGAGGGSSVEIDPASSAGAPVALGEFTVLAIELRRLIASLRPADARDLRPAHALGEPDVDAAAPLDAIEALVNDTDRLRDELDDALDGGDAAALADAVERFARIGIATGAAPTDTTAAAALEELAAQRMATVAAIKVDPADRRPGLEGRLAALLHARVPILGRFPLAGDGLGGEAVAFPTDLAGKAEVDDWLDAAGRVRADVGRLATVGMLSELLTAGGGLRPRAGQAPILDGDRWAATTLPAASGGGRLSVAAVTGPAGPPAPGAPACGLVVDRWAERIPGTEQVTGLTFQFDAPGNRPPQSCLLAMTRDGEAWSLGLVATILLETLDWVTLRAVAPEDLVDYGRSVPTVFVPNTVTPWAQEP